MAEAGRACKILHRLVPYRRKHIMDYSQEQFTRRVDE